MIGGRVVVVAAALAAAGCATFTRSVRSDHNPSPDSAYLYGNFLVDGSETIGFVVRCVDGMTYTIGFSKVPRVQVIKVKPSRCSLDQIEYHGGGHVIPRDLGGRRPSSPAFRPLG